MARGDEAERSFQSSRSSCTRSVTARDVNHARMPLSPDRLRGLSPLELCHEAIATNAAPSALGTVERVATFVFRFEPVYRVAARAFGVTPARAKVTVDDETFEARYGPWRVRTPRSNVTTAEVTGPYAIWKTAGPARLAVTDRGLTFASNRHRGVRVEFATPVRGMAPTRLLRHPELTVTVADAEGLAALLSQ